jgi:hypothetical protein
LLPHCFALVQQFASTQLAQLALRPVSDRLPHVVTAALPLGLFDELLQADSATAAKSVQG